MIFIVLLYIAATIFDVFRTTSPLVVLSFAPPLALVLTVVLQNSERFRMYYVLFFISTLLLDGVTNLLFGTTGTLVFLSILVANLLLRSVEESRRKTLFTLGIVTASYIILRAVVL